MFLERILKYASTPIECTICTYQICAWALTCYCSLTLSRKYTYFSAWPCFSEKRSTESTLRDRTQVSNLLRCSSIQQNVGTIQQCCWSPMKWQESAECNASDYMLFQLVQVLAETKEERIRLYRISSSL